MKQSGRDRILVKCVGLRLSILHQNPPQMPQSLVVAGHLTLLLALGNRNRNKYLAQLKSPQKGAHSSTAGAAVRDRCRQNAAWMDYDTTCILARQIQENERIALCTFVRSGTVFGVVEQ